MTQKRTERLDQSRHTAPLHTGDLGLFATAIVLRGRRVLGKRAPKALQKADRALAMPAVRAALNALSRVVERVVTFQGIVKVRLSDLMQAIARNTVGRVQNAIMAIAGAIKSKLPGGR
ncbi:MAG: hypothetical protein JWM80_4885 [Cyanobacteria bacterium RYN_339]|nr:hypothetical protein [Cyanobacteria bacterium RYN_339]